MKPPEHQDIEKEITKDQFNQWNTVLEKKGWKTTREIDESSDLQYDFKFDRMLDEESLVDADRVTVLQNQGHRLLKHNSFGPTKGEHWISIRIRPTDPYRSPFIKRNENTYDTSETEVFLSDQGRAYEVSQRGSVYSVEETRKRSPSLVHLKGKPERITENNLSSSVIESLQPLRGQTLERLMFLLDQVKTGNVTPWQT